MLKQETGILLLAIGHPYYGRMAYNLAMSIKAVDRTTSITLVYTEAAVAHINQRNMWVFDNKTLIDSTDQPFGKKLELYDFTPYERTLYIDVDTLWVSKQSPAQLFAKLKGIPFTSITEGMHDYEDTSKSDPNKKYFFWADLEEIKKVYDVTRYIYQWRSEFIYFEKCELTEALFCQANSIYKEPLLNSVKMFGNHIPDELAINIACSMLDVHPHIYKWKPTYWNALNGGSMPSIAELQYLYYVISCGSNAAAGALRRVYDRVCAASAYKLGLQHVFPLISKKDMIITRQLM